MAPMAESVLARVPVVGGMAFIERVRRQPSAFSVTLQPEPDNRYFQQAIAVVASGEKLGYVAPEVARRYYAPLTAEAAPEVTCPARRASTSDHDTSGVELLLDFSAVPVSPID
jgi:hypothetical protein